MLCYLYKFPEHCFSISHHRTTKHLECVLCGKANLVRLDKHLQVVHRICSAEVGMSQFEEIMSAKSVVNVMFCPSHLATRMLSL